MSIQMNFLGGVSSSIITAQAVEILALVFSGTATASVIFATNGTQKTSQNGSNTSIGNWVSPSFTAEEWEIRATLDSGATPDTGALSTWQDFSTDREWSLSLSEEGSATSSLIFDFRRVGNTDPEITVSPVNLSVENIGPF